ncbi:hypothetical protein CA51_43400 [Rosistilla oblonga]|uniref:DUF1552 domain-containing protein n=1 Tax=Rosistilla oblonga TaxID=2527990 RepID=UPI00118C1D22|nr:DUF1552 domain-containing protein [Rosistilla oblonga]QDV14440.1 hypothetical protein CA51_43400 [Rosistilla oblonga]
MIHNQQINRRIMLRGLGVAMGLPLLEAMTPMARSVMAAPSSKTMPTRMACVFFPNGVIVPKWRPAKGPELVLGESLQALQPLKHKLTMVSGLALDNGRAKKDGAGDHARAGSTFLTAARPVKTSTDIKVGVSVDQLAAQQIGQETRLASIELGVLGSRNAGSCDSGYSCAYSSNVSWRSENQPAAKETVPRLAFERLFGTGDNAATRERDFYRKSILDVVAQDARKLDKKLGTTDRRKIDEYFTGVRELERRIEMTEAEDRKGVPDLELPHGRPKQFVEHADLMSDLMVVAFQTDATRVATFMLDNAGGNRSYPDIGVNDGHHQISHHSNHEGKVANLQKIDAHLAERLAYFLQKLDSVQEAGGTLLDHSMVLYGSGLSDGNRHRHEDLPIVIAGGARGRIKTNRHIELGEETPMANLFMSMLDIVGAPVESIGDSTGRLDQLTTS